MTAKTHVTGLKLLQEQFGAKIRIPVTLDSGLNMHSLLDTSKHNTSKSEKAWTGFNERSANLDHRVPPYLCSSMLKLSHLFLRLNIIATESAMSSHPSSLLYFVETDMVDGLFPSPGQIRMLFCLARLKYALENKLHITIQGSMISFSHITPHVPFKCLQDLNQHQPPLWIGQCYDVYQRSFDSQHSYSTVTKRPQQPKLHYRFTCQFFILMLLLFCLREYSILSLVSIYLITMTSRFTQK